MASSEEDMLVRYAVGVLRPHRTVHAMVRLFLSRRAYRFFALAYSYFRWLDDEVDDSSDDALAEAALQRADAIIKGVPSEPIAYAERCLSKAVTWSEEWDPRLRDCMRQMLLSIDADYRRNGQLPNAELLSELCRQRVCSYLNTLRILTNQSALYDDPPSYGVFCDQVHILRDFREDAAKGIYNCSGAEAAQFGLTADATCSGRAWITWARHRHHLAKQVMRAGLAELLHVPPRYGLLCALNYGRYVLLWASVGVRLWMTSVAACSRDRLRHPQETRAEKQAAPLPQARRPWYGNHQDRASQKPCTRSSSTDRR